MTLTVTVNGTAIDDAIPPSSVQSTQRADDGDVGFGGFLVDDPDALIATTGHHMVVVEESACSQPRLFTGYLTERDMARSLERGMIAGDDARVHDATMVDLNAVFAFRILEGAGAKRPEETIDQRMAWLLAHDSLAPFIEDTGFVTSSSLVTDAADYTGATPKAVLDDLVARTADFYTYFAFWDATAGAVGLYFGPESSGIGESPLSISNDMGDINGTTVFAPDAEAKLARTPEEVYSEVVLVYGHGTKRLYRRRPSTAAAYGFDRGTTIERPYTGKLTTAQKQAEDFLSKHAIETDTITVSILVPPESAGLAIAGQRIDVKFTHLDGYTAWTSMRIVTSTSTAVTDVANLYRLELVLVLPVAGSSPPSTCDGSTNPLDGLEATEGATNVPDGIFGGSGVGGTIQNPFAGTDGDIEPAAQDTAHYVDGVWSGTNTAIREFLFTLPATSSVRKVTVWGSYNERGLHTGDDDEKCYVKVNGTTYFQQDYATAGDQDVWSLGTTLAATWDFGTYVSTDTIVFGETHSNTDYIPYFRLYEIAACLSDVDEEEDLAQTPTSPVIATTDPTSTDDANDGYTVGQTWVNTATGDVFTLTDATVGAAVWTPMGSGGEANIYDARWFNVEDYGAVHDDATDDTVAIQAAIDAAFAAGGGTIWFPSGTYLVAGALRDTGTFNSQLEIPVASAYVSLTFRGEIGSTLRSSWNGTISGHPAVISCGTHDSTTVSLVFLRFEQIRIKVPTNPKLTGIDATKAATLRWHALNVTSADPSSTTPTHSNAVGIDFPWALNDQNSGGEDLWVQGFYIGFRPGEQFVAEAIYCSWNVYAAELRGAIGSPEYLQHAISIQRLNVWYCLNGLLFSGDERWVYIDLMDVETEDPSWETVYCVDDPSNYARGFIGWHTGNYGGGPTDGFTMNGGAGLSLHGGYAKRWRLASIVDLPTGTNPSTNPTNGRRLYTDSATGHLSARTSTGSVIDYESSGTPATTVADETTWGVTPAVGTDTEYARQDHTHGSPANPVAAAVLEALGVRGELIVSDGTTGPNGINVSSYVEEEDAHTTTSATLEDITDVTTTITLQRSSHVAAWLNTQISASGVCVIGIALNFDGTDHDEMQHALSGTDAAALAVVHRTATELPPGTYTVKGRMRRVSGASTPSVDRADLFVMAMGHSGPVMLTNEAEDDYLYANLA